MVAKSLGPFYKLSDFVRDCSTPGKAFVRKSAKADAKCFFDFETQERILSFLSKGDFDDIEHQNSDMLDHDPDKGTPFDAYQFKIGPKYVYFAFYQRGNGNWVIKSFHPPHVGEKAPQLSHTPFKNVLERLKK